MIQNKHKKRCAWVTNDSLYIAYHDTEWGVPVHDDKKLFEFLILETAQAGLSWLTILRKRENFRSAFADFSPEAVARFNGNDIEILMNNSGIIRNFRKIDAAINNARAFLKIQEKYGSFNNYIWGFVGNSPIINRWKKPEDVPAFTKESQALSKDMKHNGFKFIGPTICYAHMQATGMVNDHTIDCFRYDEINDLIKK